MSLVIGTYFWQPDAGSKFAHAYAPDDVRRLQRMVARHCTVPHQFAVITDRPELFEGNSDIRAIRIDQTKHVPGTCFVRLMTFHPNGMAMIGDKVLVIDLDTLIVGNIDHLVSREENLVLWRNPARIPWHNPTMKGRPYYNTSVLLHRCGTMPDIWESFDPHNPRVRDDQWWLAAMLGADMPYFDGEKDGVYRLGRKGEPGTGVDGALPPNACIVTFPGSEGKWTDPAIRAANPWIEAHLE